VKTFALVFFFGVVGFFVGVFIVDQLFRWTGPFFAIILSFVAIPFSAAAGVMVGFYVAQRLWG
jgi:hypothetical protein